VVTNVLLQETKLQQNDWAGVFPAITTPFRPDLTIDYQALESQLERFIQSGCQGIVALGSLGEAPVLEIDEKVEVLTRAARVLRGRIPLVAGISSMSTTEAMSLAKAAAGAGADGLMVLPPYVYRSDWRETKAHVSAVLDATPLSAMLYNNPVAYGTDILPEQIVQLRHEHNNFHAVKESSGSLRRITQLKHLAADSLALFVGMDDVVVESVAAGAVGWIAGLVNAFPGETVRLFDLAQRGPSSELDSLYAWFLPLLRLDTVPKFVQMIKLLQEEVGMGSARVRPPRLELIGAERAEVLAVLRACMQEQPTR
jgi:dihydrodipicolinate synthase/N-acetylneuraminate lyase